MCHAINGEGGLKGVELNYPMNVTEYWKEKMLRQWIDKPESIRISTAMPGLDKSLKGKAREQTLNDLISYLKEMAKHKFKPEAAQ